MLILEGEPKSTQSIYKIACKPYPTIYMSAEGKSIKEDYQWQARSQWKDEMIDTPFEINVRLYHKTKRKQDIDNFCKLLFDACNRIVWEDDNLIEKMTISKHHDPLRPRIELEIILPPR